MSDLRSVTGDLLGKKEYREVLELSAREPRLLRTVLSLLYDADELIRWRAVTVIGRLAAAEPDRVRPLVKRFIWWMNDESGGIGWSSAPALGEIGRQAPELLRDAARVVVFWRQERILLQGVMWAVGRLSLTYPEVVGEAVPDMVNFLGDGDPGVRGTAAWSLGEIGDPRALRGLQGLRSDRSEVRIYDEEELEVKEIRRVAEEAAGKLRAR